MLSGIYFSIIDALEGCCCVVSAPAPPDDVSSAAIIVSIERCIGLLESLSLLADVLRGDTRPFCHGA